MEKLSKLVAFQSYTIALSTSGYTEGMGRAHEALKKPRLQPGSTWKLLENFTRVLLFQIYKKNKSVSVIVTLKYLNAS